MKRVPVLRRRAVPRRARVLVAQERPNEGQPEVQPVMQKQRAVVPLEGLPLTQRLAGQALREVVGIRYLER